MKKSNGLEGRPRISSRREKVSPSVLSAFLMRSADSLMVAGSGNLALAEALRDLAKTVRKKLPSAGTAKTPPPERPVKPALSNEHLRLMSIGEIEGFVADEERTKEELLDLAEARFSIPRSQLKRMKVIEVREALNSAIHHESSIEILGQEARKDGAGRRS